MITADLSSLSPRIYASAELNWPAIGTLIDDPSALPAPRPPLMKRMCCQYLPIPDDAPPGTKPDRCDLVLGWVVCASAMDGLISHGACEPCATRWLDEAAAYQASEYTLDVGAGGESATRAATPHASRGAVNDNASKAPGHADVLPLCAPGGCVDLREAVALPEAGRPRCLAGDTTHPDGGRTLS